MPIHELKDQIGRLPEQPGVYLYKNAEGDTIYVGKARALRDRVRNYLGAYGSDPKTDALLNEKYGARRIQFDSDGNDRHHNQQDGDKGQADEDVQELADGKVQPAPVCCAGRY